VRQRFAIIMALAVGCSRSETATSTKPTATAKSAASVAPSASASAPACPEDMRVIPAGTFRPDGTSSPTDVKQFCIDTTEVTVAAYKACSSCSAPEASSLACNSSQSKRDDHPINCVTWAQADAYCKAVSKRLPTDIEWEYAATGSEEKTYPWGNAAAASQLCWHRSPREGTCAVASFESGRSPFGVEDMAGNVREWTATESSDKPGSRVVRGSGWGPDKPVRNGARDGLDPKKSADDLGFRCAK